MERDDDPLGSSPQIPMLKRESFAITCGEEGIGGRPARFQFHPGDLPAGDEEAEGQEGQQGQEKSDESGHCGKTDCSPCKRKASTPRAG